MTARISSIWTCWPAFTVSSVTVPPTAAETVCSIFIASTTATGCPLATGSPAVTCTVSTVPGMGERTVPSASPAASALAVTAGSAGSDHACPSRPSQVVSPSRAYVKRSVRPP
jgi:hypothetical protein